MAAGGKDVDGAFVLEKELTPVKSRILFNATEDDIDTEPMNLKAELESLSKKKKKKADKNVKEEDEELAALKSELENLKQQKKESKQKEMKEKKDKLRKQIELEKEELKKKADKEKGDCHPELDDFPCGGLLMIYIYHEWIERDFLPLIHAFGRMFLPRKREKLCSKEVLTNRVQEMVHIFDKQKQSFSGKQLTLVYGELCYNFGTSGLEMCIHHISLQLLGDIVSMNEVLCRIEDNKPQNIWSYKS